MIDLPTLERLEAEATPGPWETYEDECSVTCDVAANFGPLSLAAESLHNEVERAKGCCGYEPDPFTNADAALIVALRNSAPALLTELRVLRAEVERRGGLVLPDRHCGDCERAMSNGGDCERYGATARYCPAFKEGK